MNATSLPAVASLVVVFAAGAAQPGWGQKETLPMPLQADLVLQFPAGEERAQFTVDRPVAGEATILVKGLSRGGWVEVAVNGKPPASLELLATGGLAQGRADCALLRAAFQAGRNEVAVAEHDGAQVVRLPGTNHWFATSTEAAGHPQFSLDLDELLKVEKEYSVNVYYGPAWEPFLWFSGRWDHYYGEVFAERATNVTGSTGPLEATLAYTLEYPPRNLVMPTEIALLRDPQGECFTLRVRQTLRAVGEPSWKDNLEFLHVVINPTYGLDWQDGVPDYTWFRSQREDCPEALPGSHTAMIRFDDNSRRVYPYRSSTADPEQVAISGFHHTSAAIPLEAVNTIGGFLTKSGVGSCGWIFSKYRSTFREDLSPLHSHCGDGADNHFLLFWGGLFTPLGMKAGDEVEIEYGLTMLPSEVLREDIEDLNEADLYLFGKEKEQKSQITGWLGTKQAVGLQRSDGSLIALGIGREPGRLRVPAMSQEKAQRVYRFFDLVRSQRERLQIKGGTVETKPGWFTVIDCGSVLNQPE